jgi:hypothetical protein
MIKQKLGFLVLGAATFACSGRYYEVGGMDGVAGTTGAAGSAAVGGNASSTAGTSQVDPGVGGFAGTGNAGPSTPAGDLCVPSGGPPVLTGAFAEPSVVWERVSLLTWGHTPRTPPTKFPVDTTPAWADAQVTRAFQEVAASKTAPGVEVFLRQALGLEPDAAFSQHWGTLAAINGRLLNLLLRAPLGEPGRVGIFTEPSWLEKRTTISARGAGIEDALFGRPVPAPPAGIENPEPNPNLSDRANLEAAVSSNAPCTSCHMITDPTGFALGNFATDGSYRELDHGLPVDTASSRSSGMYPEVIEFDGIADFGEKFENDCGALQGIATTFVRTAVYLTEPEGDQYQQIDSSIPAVQQAFVNSDRTYQDLVRAYIQSPAGLRP